MESMEFVESVEFGESMEFTESVEFAESVEFMELQKPTESTAMACSCLLLYAVP